MVNKRLFLPTLYTLYLTGTPFNYDDIPYFIGNWFEITSCMTYLDLFILSRTNLIWMVGKRPLKRGVKITQHHVKEIGLVSISIPQPKDSFQTEEYCNILSRYIMKEFIFPE